MIHSLLHLNLVDFIILGFIVLSIIISLLRGFVREALSLVTLLIAVYVAFSLSSSVAPILSGMISSESTRTVVAFIGLFLLILIAGAIINFLIGRLISVSGFGPFDRLLGILFGAARGILVLALLVLMIQGTSLTERGWWRHSQLIPLFEPVTAMMKDLFPKQAKQVDALMLHEEKHGDPLSD